MCKDKKSRKEKGTEIGIHFLRDAAKNGNQQAVKTLQRVDQLNKEHDHIRATVRYLISKPRISDNDHAQFYQAALSAMDRLVAIPIEKHRIIQHTILQN